MPTHSPDRFDDVPADLQRVGAHRAPRRPRRTLWVFGWAALATGLLVLAGVIAITVIGNNNTFTGTLAPPPSASAAPNPSATTEPVIDESLLVTVLDGSGSDGLADEAAEVLTGDGWNVGSRANASSSDIETTTVYFWDPVDEGAARGLANSLGSAEVVLSESFAPVEGDPAVVARLTVVLGGDYAE